VQLILVDRRLARARTMNLSRSTLVWAVLGFMMLVVAAVAGAYALTFRLAAQREMPLVRNLVSLVMHDRLVQNEQYVRDNVSSMAKIVGEMQARMMRLDALGERVSKLAGIRPEEFNFREVPGLGGAEPAASRPLTLVELQTQAHSVGQQVDERTDFMNVVETELVASAARSALLPRNAPIVDGFVGSGFGMRTDPFTGELTMHSGIDFAAPVGTAIFAAAGGGGGLGRDPSGVRQCGHGRPRQRPVHAVCTYKPDRRENRRHRPQGPAGCHGGHHRALDRTSSALRGACQRRAPESFQVSGKRQARFAAGGSGAGCGRSRDRGNSLGRTPPFHPPGRSARRL